MTWIDWFFDWFCVYLPVPPAPSISLSFEAHPTMPNALVGTVTLDAAPAAPAIAHRPVVVTVNGTAQPSVDYAAPLTFQCNEGDTYAVSAENVSAGGVSSAATVVSGTAHDTATVPAAPGITVAFVLAPPALHAK